MPVRFTDEQLTALMQLSRPLAPQCRVTFMQILANELSGRADIGDGELYRVVREIIRTNNLFEAPLGHLTDRAPRGPRARTGTAR